VNGSSPNPLGSFATVRYNSDGAIDTTFNGSGTAFTQFVSGGSPGARKYNTPETVLIRTDGKILVVGITGSCCSPQPLSQIAMVQYNPDGSLDTSFGNAGKIQIGFSTTTSARDAAIQADNKIVIAGNTQGNIKAPIVAMVSRFNADGSLDSTFSGDGRNTIQFSGGFSSSAYAIAIQPDGKIVIGGDRSQTGQMRDFLLARFEASNCTTPNCSGIKPTKFDFDGDGKSDFSIYRPAAGEWWYLRSSDGGNRAFQFGSSSDKIVPADYTGDGKTDVAFFRPSTGQWFILRSEDFSYYAFPFGIAEDVPAPADYDGDGKADAAVYRPSNSVWYVLKSTGGTAVHQYGASGDAPVPADYDGDGRADYATYNNSTKTWKVRTGGSESASSFSGAATNRAVPADYTGDGKTDIAFYDTAGGTWFVIRSENRTYYAVQFGIAGAVPAPADYDGDGKTDLAIYQPSTGEWWYQASSANGEARVRQFGISTDKPVPAAYIP
jgi:uncharacterized delta-60 repeat protein